jgi:CRISPR/Cas system-associated protein Cas7 (RAMP superfamily)
VGSVRRKANTLGIEVKTVNDWTQFIEDKQVHGILYSKENERFRRSGFFQMSEMMPQRTMEESKREVHAATRKSQNPIMEEIKEEQSQNGGNRKTRNS